MARLWFTGFEANTTTLWVEFSNSSGTLSVGTTNARSGSYALRTNPTAGISYIAHKFLTTAGNGPYFGRGYLLIGTAPSANTMVMCISGAAGGTTSWGIKLNTNRTLSLIAGGSTIATSSAIPLNEYHRLELRMENTSGSNKIEFLLDGTSIGAYSPGSLPGSIDTFTVGVLESTTADLYWDDLAVNDSTGSSQTGYPGAGSIVHMLPDSAGDTNQLLTSAGGAGSSTNYQAMDERTPDDNTTYLKTTATTDDGKNDTYNLQSSSSAGIGGSDTITLVAVRIRYYLAYSNTWAGVIARMRYSSTNVDSPTIQADSATVWKTFVQSSSGGGIAAGQESLIGYVAPGGGAWSPSVLDSLQVGVVSKTNTFNNENRFSQAYAMVEYVPSPGTNRAQTGISRITASTNKDNLGKSRITASTPRNQTGLSRVTASTPRTNTGKGRIALVTARIIQGVARSGAVVLRTITGKGNLLHPSTAGRAIQTDSSTFIGTAHSATTLVASVGTMGWVYVPGTSTKGAFVKYGSLSTGWGVGMGGGDWDTNGAKLVGLFESVRWIDTGYSFPSAGWYHVAMSLDASGVPTFWVNGSNKGSFSGTGSNAGSGSTSIGSDAGGRILASAKFKEWKLYHRALTQADITADYNNERGMWNPAAAQLPDRAWWRLNEDTGTTYASIAGVAQDLSLVSGTVTSVAENSIAIPGAIDGLSRITASTNKTQTGLSRITAKALRTITGLSQIVNTQLRTITGKTSVLKAILLTIPGVSKITAGANKLQTGISRITVSTLRTILGKSSILKAILQAQTGKGDIRNAVLRTQPGKSAIKATQPRTQPGLSRITNFMARLQLGKANIRNNTLKTITGKASVLFTRSAPQTGVSNIIANPYAPAAPGPSASVFSGTSSGLHRRLFFKIERLDADENVIETLTPQLQSGNVTVEYDRVNRRACSFSLLQGLPDDWMSSRWKLYYGLEIAGIVTYYPEGVFIPVNPKVDDVPGGSITSYQGVDKAQILVDSFNDIPTTFTAGTTLKTIMTTILDLVDEQKRNLEDVPYSLATDFTFEEGVTLEHILSTLVRSFPADWYYDRDGYARLIQLPPAEQRPIRQVFTEDENSIFVDSNFEIDTSKYFNRAIVIGGRADTGIFRQTYSNSIERTRAGRWITKTFKEDAATSQQQVNDLATQYLEIGTQLPREIKITGFPIPDLEPKEIIMKDGRKYEVVSLNVPLSLDLQNISAGEIL